MKVPSFPAIKDEYCILTAFQNHVNRGHGAEPKIKMRCIKRDLEKFYKRENPWNLLDGYYYEEYVGRDSSYNHLDSMSKPLITNEIDLGKQVSQRISKFKETLTRLWSPGIRLTKEITTFQVNYAPLIEQSDKAQGIWSKLYDFWFKSAK
eukprot:NODE_67_length_25542_cov_1.476831.p20 type:complete len:150 gc:universal NODE_67_length_25542_cov_1.476831:20604-21053(+)